MEARLQRSARARCRRSGRRITSYNVCYTKLLRFWGLFWDFADIIASKPFDQVVDDPKKMPGARWFAGAELNFAENLLRWRDDRPAIVSYNFV